MCVPICGTPGWHGCMHVVSQLCNSANLQSLVMCLPVTISSVSHVYGHEWIRMHVYARCTFLPACDIQHTVYICLYTVNQ